MSHFQFNNGTINALPVNILPGVRAAGITAYYGLNEAASTMYLWHGGTIEILTGTSGNAQSTGSITVAPGIQNFTLDANRNFGYATAAGSTMLYIVDVNAKTVSKTVDFGQGAIPNAVAVSQDLNSGSTIVYVVDSVGSYHTVNPTTGTFTTVGFTTKGVDSGIPAVTPDGSQLWIPYPTGAIVIFDAQSNSFVADSLNVAYPTQIVFSLDGASAFVLNSPPSGQGSIYSINTQTLQTNWHQNVGTKPTGLSLSPFGSFLLVANSGDGTISQIAAADGTQLSLTDVGMTPVGVVAFNQLGQPVI